MRIFYGVQGTGNGHISRAMAMAAAFKAYPEIELTWLISGRAPGRTYAAITDYEWRQGLTLVTRNGRLSPGRTALKNNLWRTLKDIRSLELSGYDLVISDFEPITSHAARRQGIPVTGISHQCAFDKDIPMRGEDMLSSLIMRHFAPVSQPIGLHWHHFDQTILPPILHIDKQVKCEVEPKRVLVYLPMENPAYVVRCLKDIADHQFWFYHPECQDGDEANVHIRAVSVEGFKQDLYASESVICNTGFELISECLSLGKRILTRPLSGQMEQQSNAEALDILGYAKVTEVIDAPTVGAWLESATPGLQIPYPDVAKALAGWIANGRQQALEELCSELWHGVPEPTMPFN